MDDYENVDDYYNFPEDPIELNYTENYSEEEKESVEEWSWFFVFFSSLVAIVLILSKYLHENVYLHYFISEAALILIVGMIAGFIVSYFFASTSTSTTTSSTDDEYTEEQYIGDLANYVLSFSPNIFFMAMLPPIIFNSGYASRSELLYNHIEPIILFACIGTVISTFCTAGTLFGLLYTGMLGGGPTFVPTIFELLTFGSLISATDTVSVLSVLQSKNVNPTLFGLVFGESALNDAVALVLFNTFADFLKQEEMIGFQDMKLKDLTFVGDFLADAILSPALGICISVVTALMFKHIDFRAQPMLELPLFILLMYIPFVIAECLHISGIVTIFFSGIAARRYIEPNVSTPTATSAEAIFKTAAFLAETSIFLELGLSVFGLAHESFNWYLIGWSFIATLLSRAVAIYPITIFYNWLVVKRATAQHALKGDTTSNSNSFIIHNDDDAGAIGGSKQQQLLEYNVCSDGLIKENVYRLSTYSDDGAESVNTITTPKTRITSSLPPPPCTNSLTKLRNKLIPARFAHFMWFSGLRGAVAYACARKFPNTFGNADSFIAATMCIVLFSIIVMGGLTEYTIHILEIETNIDVNEYMNVWNQQRKKQDGKLQRFEKRFIFEVVVRQPPLDDPVGT